MAKKIINRVKKPPMEWKKKNLRIRWEINVQGMQSATRIKHNKPQIIQLRTNQEGVMHCKETPEMKKYKYSMDTWKSIHHS